MRRWLNKVNRWLSLKAFVFVIPVVILFVYAAPEPAPDQLSPPSSSIPEVLFGMHIHGMVVPRPGIKTPDEWPNVPFGAWRLWDASVAWPQLEPKRGTWNFNTLDKYVSLSESHNVEILLTLGLTPQWASSMPDQKSAYGLGNAAPPKNLEDWRTYVRTVATRYKGRIHAYEVWNEPNSPGMFTGDAKMLVELTNEAYRTLHEVDPSIIIVSPSINASDPKTIDLFEQFLKAGGGNYSNVIGYHLYPPVPKVPEQIPELAQKVRGVMKANGAGNKQLWDTETGWDIVTKIPLQRKTLRGLRVLNDAEAAAYVARAYILAWASGVSRLYWYAWDNTLMGLIEPDVTTVKLSAVAYGQVENWLVGARMKSCGSDKNGTWTSVIVRDGGYQGWIIWNPDHRLDFSLPNTWGIRQSRDLGGNVRDLSGVKTVRIGPSPVIFENKLR